MYNKLYLRGQTMFNFFNKKNKFSDYVAIYSPTVRDIGICRKSTAVGCTGFDDEKIISLEQAFLMKNTNKYFFLMESNIPKEVLLYIKENALNMLVFTDSGRLIGYEFDDDLALTKEEKRM
jgi:hypothetical protein